MEAWYRVDVPLQDCSRNGTADQLQKAFEVMFVTSESPKDAALFEWHDENFETNRFYFSPSASRLLQDVIERLGGVECAPPAFSDRLVLLVGHPSACEVLQNEQRMREVLSRVSLSHPRSGW